VGPDSARRYCANTNVGSKAIETIMNIKIFLIFSGYFLLTVITGLMSCDDCRPGPDKFKVTSINWNTYKVTLTTGNLVLSEITNGVTFNQLGIHLKPQIQTYFSFKKNNYSLTTGLYACSPIDPTTNEKIINIEITSNKDFTDEHPQGTDISELFDIVISNWYKGISADKYDLKEYIRTNPFVTKEMTLILKHAPQTTDEYKFTIKYFQAGAVLDYSEFTTSDILVIK
jgi:hypothetical protein